MATLTEALRAGDEAPAFRAVDQEGAVHTLKSYKGKTVVLYFYPKDNTPGCTREACDFRDNWQAFQRKGAVVLGVSPDSEKSHAAFAARQKLNFPLLADVDKALCKAYGVWQEKTLYGRKFMGVVRSTFVIGPDGRILRALYKVGVDGHAAQILEAL